jgi:hypothetical protein
MIVFFCHYQDPELSVISTGLGRVQFLQLVGVCEEELRAVQRWVQFVHSYGRWSTSGPCVEAGSGIFTNSASSQLARVYTYFFIVLIWGLKKFTRIVNKLSDVFYLVGSASVLSLVPDLVQNHWFKIKHIWLPIKRTKSDFSVKMWNII